MATSLRNAPIVAGVRDASAKRCCVCRAEQPRATNRVARANEESTTAREASFSRRAAFALPLLTSGAVLLGDAWPADAVQGFTAGRIPGVSTTADAQGFLTYTRPTGKSGGHGVGWSEIPPYSFKIPDGWAEQPVSIADAGGTEIDLRFQNKDEGDLMVVVAPVLRFSDVGFNAEITLEELGTPDKIIGGFAPELFGHPLEEGDIVSQDIKRKNGLSYYMWEIKPHRLVTATAFKNRVFLLSLSANGRQWRKADEKLRTIQDSFMIPNIG